MILGLKHEARYAVEMTFEVACTSPGRLARRPVALPGWALLALLAGVACNDPTGTGQVEDKDGVTVVPPPDGSTGAGLSGLGGSGGTGGGGGGVNGQPCEINQDCDDLNPCTTESCVLNTCSQVLAADDGDECTTDTCDMATGEINNVPVQVNDNDACTYDTCDPATGAKNSTFVTIFAEAFDSNAAGWTLGPQWFIGSAASSSAGAGGANDPPSDHSLAGDGLAGTVQGAEVAAQATPSYLTSPVIDVSTFETGESLRLVFWRWLAGDDPAEMSATVEATTGSTMTPTVFPLWNNGAGTVNDTPPLGTGWFEMRLDITAAVQSAIDNNTSLRVRFGFTKGGAMPSVGGWNVDDVEIRRTLSPADANICTLDLCEDDMGTATATHPPLPEIEDKDDTTEFVCVDGVGPQQQ